MLFQCIIVAFFVGLIIVTINLFPKYKFTYFKSPDKKHIVTRVDYDGKTYFTYGKYESKNIPRNYISPDYAGFNSGFELFLFFEGDTATLYAQYGTFTSIGNNYKLKSEVFNGYGNDSAFLTMKNDNTGKYYFLTD